MTKSNFLRPSFLLRYLELKHPCLPFEYFFILFLKHFLSSMIFFCERGIVKCKGCFTSQYTQGKLGQRKVDLVILSDIGLLTLNPIFSGPKSWNWKFQCPSITFIPSAIFEGVMKVWNIATFLLGHPESTLENHRLDDDAIKMFNLNGLRRSQFLLFLLCPTSWSLAWIEIYILSLLSCRKLKVVKVLLFCDL